MNKGRLEAFTDGVIAIIITIMVLELKVPDGTSFEALASGFPIFVAYALSYANVAIFWNNHHHMLHAAARVNGRVLWANSFLLFWLSLVPFSIRWIDEAGIAPLPTAGYGAVLLMASVGYGQLQRAIIACNKNDPKLAMALGRDVKGKISFAAYIVAVPVALFVPLLAIAIYVLNALIWLVPDRRIETPDDRPVGERSRSDTPFDRRGDETSPMNSPPETPAPRP